jgi:transglutaminase-like putative cysteine protease
MASARTIPNAGFSVGIQRYFEIAVYLLVAAGFATLASTGELDIATLIFAGSALLLRGYGFFSEQPLLIPEAWTTSLTLGYVAFYLVDFFVISGGFVNATVHLVLFVMVVRLYSARKDRDYYFLAVIGFLMVLAAAILTVDSIFLLVFGVFLLIAVLTVMLMEMKRSAAKASIQPANSGGESAHKHMVFSLARLAPAIVLGIFLGATAIFFVLPRISGGYLGAFAHKSALETGFSDQVDLGGIGQIQQSGAVVMHVSIDGDDRGNFDLKWRGVALSNFNGKGWRNPQSRHVAPRLPGGDFSVVPPDAHSGLRRVGLAGRRSIHYSVLMEPIGTDVFFFAPTPSVLRGNYRAVAIDRAGAVFNMDGSHPIGRYEAWSELDGPTPTASEDEIRPVDQIYLNLPPLDPRIRTLAAQITSRSKNDYERATTIESYLRTHFGYTLELPGRLADDPVAEFLFVRRKGHCEYFASAMAVMLRELGIPTRMVTGFRGAEFNDLTSQYVVKESNAHAWVEAFFPEYGWVSFDPTPSAVVPRATGWARVALYLDAMKSFWRDWIVSYDAGQQRTLGQEAIYGGKHWVERIKAWYGEHYRHLLNKARSVSDSASDAPQRWGGVAVVVTAVLLLLMNFARLRRLWLQRLLVAKPGKAPRLAATLWYERMTAAVGKRGWKKSPAQTPREFLRSIGDQVTREKVAVFTQRYEGARFGESREDAEMLPELYEEVRGVGRR